jgi:predicted acylesterase/phospholipase RssA
MFDCVVLSGAATKAWIQTGIIHKHENELQNVHTYVGTSAGAVLCTLLSTGASAIEIYNIGRNTKCQTPTGLGWIGSLSNFFTKLGLIQDNTYLDEVKKYISNKYKGIPTLKQLYEITKKNLLIVATGLIARSRIVFSHKSHPDMLVTDALEMSIRMPLLFTPIFFNNDLVVDGGYRRHFPIDLRIGRTLAVHTYNKVRDAVSMLKEPSIVEYIGLLLGCASPLDMPNTIDGILYDIAYEKRGPLPTSEDESLQMFKLGANAIPLYQT